MARIPTQDGTVFDHLVPATRMQLARIGDTELVAPTHLPATPADLAQGFEFFYEGYLEFPADDRRHFAERLLVLLTSCEERRFDEYEHQSWWEFVEADRRSDFFRKYFADGLTRSLVAAKAREMSTRTGGYILLQLLFDLARPGGQADRVLDGPTNDVWIDPWEQHLRRQGVQFHLDTKVTQLHLADGRLSGVTVVTEGAEQTIEADYYVAAMPVEVMVPLVSADLKRAAPSLGGLTELRTAWMNGILFYLDQDVPVVHGHTLYIDSAWALTSISQQQFWRNRDLQDYGDGRVEGILSVDVSDWTTPGTRHPRPAASCTREEIKEEVLTQLQAHLNDDELNRIDDRNIVDWFLDPAIVHPNPSEATNLEPLLINTAGSWQRRPDAVTEIPNLFLASDYVRTHTDLATMEAANEAARRAVNGILEAAGSAAPRCRVWKLAEPQLFAPLRGYDQWRWTRGLGHDPKILWFARVFLLPIVRVAYLVLRFLRPKLIALGLAR